MGHLDHPPGLAEKDKCNRKFASKILILFWQLKELQQQQKTRRHKTRRLYKMYSATTFESLQKQIDALESAAESVAEATLQGRSFPSEVQCCRRIL